MRTTETAVTFRHPFVLAALAATQPAGTYRLVTEEEEILYTLWDELQRNQSVSDATYARAVAKFGEAGVIDTLGITGYYTMLAMVLNTARTPLPDGAKPSLSALQIHQHK